MTQRLAFGLAIGKSLIHGKGCFALIPFGQQFKPAFGIVERWRGAIIHWIMVDNSGKPCRGKIKDPSFVNWPALSFAVLKNIVPDFPLCNKSFGLSYSGNDL